MRQTKYSVNLNEEEISALRSIVDNPKTTKTRRIKAEILLDLDGKRTGYTVAGCLASMYGVSRGLVYNLMERYSKEGIEAIKKSPNSTPRRHYRMTPQVEKKVLSWIRTPPPAGKSKWSAQIIANRIMEEGLVKKISRQTIYRLLDKWGLKL